MTRGRPIVGNHQLTLGNAHGPSPSETGGFFQQIQGFSSKKKQTQKSQVFSDILRCKRCTLMNFIELSELPRASWKAARSAESSLWASYGVCGQKSLKFMSPQRKIEENTCSDGWLILDLPWIKLFSALNYRSHLISTCCNQHYSAFTININQQGCLFSSHSLVESLSCSRFRAAL